MPNAPNRFRPTKWPKDKWESLPWYQKLYYSFAGIGTYFIIATGFLLAVWFIRFIVAH